MMSARAWSDPRIGWAVAFAAATVGGAVAVERGWWALLWLPLGLIAGYSLSGST